MRVVCVGYLKMCFVFLCFLIKLRFVFPGYLQTCFVCIVAFLVKCVDLKMCFLMYSLAWGLQPQMGLAADAGNETEDAPQEFACRSLIMFLGPTPPTTGARGRCRWGLAYLILIVLIGPRPPVAAGIGEPLGGILGLIGCLPHVFVGLGPQGFGFETIWIGKAQHDQACKLISRSLRGDPQAHWRHRPLAILWL